MKKILLIPIMIFFIACGGVKKTQKAINAGDYAIAINTAIQNLANNKTKKGNQPYVVLLEEAYKKNTERELKYIAFLEKEGNEASYENIYKSYVGLRDLQERIKPLLPLRINDENRDAEFIFDDYETDIIEYKEDLSEYLYDNAEGLLTNASTKQEYRKAYRDFMYLKKINPDFEDTDQKIREALEKGIDYIEVRMVNNSEQIIPVRLMDELLNFNTYGLDDLWTKYHNNPLPNHAYDYKMQVSLDRILISPEQIFEKEIVQEKEIKDGFTYARDTNGAIVKDSLGNKIKVDKFKTVKCTFNRFTQFKSAGVEGTVTYYDTQSKQPINSYPLGSEFVFEHMYGIMDGDKRALDNEYLLLTDQQSVPFPSNEVMIYDAGEDLKERLKSILKNHRFN